MTTTFAGPGAVRTSRIILLGSLAFNLFFLGVVSAVAVRHYWVHAGRPIALAPARTAAERIDRLAAILPPEDAEKLRAQFESNETSVEAAHAAYRKAQEAIRAALRAQPFEVGPLRTAMADARTARQSLDLALEDVIVKAAAQMSPAGRNKLAEWTPPAHGGHPEPPR
jgi:uncharacterized membrane protein